MFRTRHRVRSSFAPRAASLKVEALEAREVLSTRPSLSAALLPLVRGEAAQVAHVGTQAGHAHHHQHRAIHRGRAAHHQHLQTPRATVGINAQPFAAPGATPMATAAQAPYTPGQVRHAYGVDQVSQDGSGQIIAIVDAYDDPTIASDLATFSQTFGLPQANLIKAVPTSGTPAFDPGWAGEIALDVEWAHAIAPRATILLVEAPSSSYADLFSAVDYAVSQGAKQVSMSWGGSASSGISYYDGHFNHPGVTFLASSGDNGAGASYPAASPFVTAVGGTSLQIDANGNRLAETAWSGSGGGVTSAESRPSYQSGFLGGKRRGVPDVAYDADPGTGYYVYDSSSGGSWYQVGGTSASAPQWAGLVALANQGRAAAGKTSLGSGYTYGTNQALYRLAGGSSYSNPYGDFVDITSGGNGYAAAPGYDVVTGLGSPVANKLVPDLINRV